MKRSYRGDRSMAMKKISCIIPCYNEEAALPYFLREIRKVADQMSATDPVLFEILFVNDGSKDRTLEILREAAKEDARVRYSHSPETSAKKPLCMQVSRMSLAIMPL